MQPRHVARSSNQTGFTLVEMIISLAVLGLLSVVMLPLLSLPAQSYVDAQRRVELNEQMSLIRAKLADDLRLAMPGSLRRTCVGNTCYLEYLELRATARYRTTPGGTAYCPATTPACPAATNANAFAPACGVESCFTTLGPLNQAVAGVNPVANTDYVAIMGLGIDPYNFALNGSMSRLTAWVNRPNDVGLRFNPTSFPVPPASAAKRVYLVAQPVTYQCNEGTRLLTKHWGYAVLPGQPTAFGAQNTARLSDSVARCRIDIYTQGLKQVASIRLNLQRTVAGQPTEQVESLIQIGVREP